MTDDEIRAVAATLALIEEITLEEAEVIVRDRLARGVKVIEL